MSADKDCCTVGDGKGNNFNPKTFRYGSTTTKNEQKYFEIVNPLPDQIRDDEEIQLFFRQYPLVPYAGFDRETAHSLLKKFIDFKTASVTTGAILRSINSYSFGGKINFVKNFLPEFDLGEESEEIGRAEKIAFGQFINTIDRGGMSWNELAENMTISDESTGNVFVELVHTETLGVKLSRIILHDPLDCLYLATKEGQRKYIVISKKWNSAYLQKYPPRMIPVFDGTPESYREFSDGTRRTMFHQKNGFYRWYGRPPAESAIIDQFNEHSIRTYLSKQAHKGWIGTTILETERANPTQKVLDNDRDRKAGFKNTADRFERNYSNRGQDPSSFMILSRPNGTKPMAVNRIAPMTDAKFVRESLTECRANISMAFDWSEALLRKEKSSGFNSDIFKTLIEIQSATKILKVQNRRSYLLNMILKEVSIFNNKPQFLDYGFKFKSTIQNLIEQKAEEAKEENKIKNQDDNNSGRSNTKKSSA